MRCVGALLCLVALAGCSRKDTPSDKQDAPKPASSTRPPDHNDEPEHESLPKHLRLDPAVITDAKIRTAPVTREVLEATIELPGEVSSDPDKTARVSALVSGRIESVSFKEGQTVKKGDVLAVIKVPELGKAKAAYTATNAKAIAAQSNADRLQALSGKRLAATQEVVASRAEADALQAEARAAEERLRALGTGTSGTAVGSQLALRAPVGGIVISRDAVVGQPVSSDQTIATIADLTEVWFLGRVFENNLDQVRIGAPAEIQLNAFPKDPFEGKVEYLSKQIDPVARTVIARIRITNRRDLLRLGLFGVARVGTGEQETTKALSIVVPRSAVTEIANKLVVFVQQADGDFDIHEVALGEGALGKVQVLRGLRKDEQVVIDGTFTLKSAFLKPTFAEDE